MRSAAAKANLPEPTDLYFSEDGVSVYLADARYKLAEFPDGHFQCCVTSPPYWGLRDYEHPDQIGAEDELDDYVRDLVSVFREVRRTLRDDGTFWLNIGDAYTSGGRTWRAPDKKNKGRAMTYRPDTPDGLKPKDLIGLPWKIAFALQADGWYLRSDIVWNKPNCQPESVKDRPTRSHEFVFLLTKSEKYYFDQAGMVEPATGTQGSKNRRTVWNINTEPFKGAHFAVFPSKLVELCVLGGTAPHDLVLDPFLGSGTVGAVAKRLNRQAVGIEVNSEFADLAVSRIRAARHQPSLL
ncbi:DNA-methyltransferase [Mesorhizobium sp. BR-1-1-10]|uniref:DNA-methyltransferase n=1 Tax=Mesorhizobium sp. BR-1-1-10 TaxID=2876660 RepID=UPI001CD14CCA|nr:site-specific DNA-methyltransferase [Mesorhizobium sp. BR-1-1-10]MBZ9975496.1 site-specific DNA-methyltransferase [Mesorhizobium sp. BR-1-1-10]